MNMLMAAAAQPTPDPVRNAVIALQQRVARLESLLNVVMPQILSCLDALEADLVDDAPVDEAEAEDLA